MPTAYAHDFFYPLKTKHRDQSYYKNKSKPDTNGSDEMLENTVKSLKKSK